MNETKQGETGDLMLGAAAIAMFLSQLFDKPIHNQDVYHWCARGSLPHVKHGTQIVASKSRIRAYFYPPGPTAAVLPPAHRPR